jgi:hypothetical protein
MSEVVVFHAGLCRALAAYEPLHRLNIEKLQAVE